MRHSATKGMKFTVGVDEKATTAELGENRNPGHGLIPGELFVQAQQLEITA